MIDPTRKITSLQNPVVKLVRSLDMRKARKETGLFVAEGGKVVATARDQGWTPQMLLMTDGLDVSPMRAELLAWGRGHGADCVEFSEPVFAKIAARDNPQSLIGVFAQRWADLPQAPAAADVWVALEDVRDPGNLGTIIRTADAVGARGVILVGNCCDPYSREAVRATMGSIFSVAVVRMDPASFAARAAAWPGEVIGTHLSATSDFRTPYGGPVLLLMGSEGPGLSPELAALCSRLVKIPMAGSADSLNLAIATSLMLYEIRRAAL